MDARYTIRKAQLLEECQVAPEVFEQVMPRLRAFLAPFVDTLQGQAPRAHAQTYVRGLLSDVERKNVESIAYHFGQDRLGLQGFIGWDDWDDAPCDTRCGAKWANNWDKPMACWCSIPRPFPSPGGSRSG